MGLWDGDRDAGAVVGAGGGGGVEGGGGERGGVGVDEDAVESAVRGAEDGNFGYFVVFHDLSPFRI